MQEARHQRADLLRRKQAYGSIKASEVNKLKQFGNENKRLKGLVADRALEKQILQDVILNHLGSTHASARSRRMSRFGGP